MGGQSDCPVIRRKIFQKRSKSDLHVVGHFVTHDFVGGTRVDAEVGTKEDLEEIGAGETIVLPLFVNGFPFSHAFVAFEDEIRMIHSDVDALVAEFAHEAAVAVVDGSRYSAKVPDGVIKGVSVDVVNGTSFRDFADEGEVLKAGEVHVTVLRSQF